MTTQVVNFTHLAMDVVHQKVIEEPAVFISIIGHADVAAFKKLVQQGSNLEPNLSTAMKELADLVTVGKIQQPYRSRSE